MAGSIVLNSIVANSSNDKNSIAVETTQSEQTPVDYQFQTFDLGLGIVLILSVFCAFLVHVKTHKKIIDRIN